MFVESKDIRPTNYEVGQIIEGKQGHQYVIVDAEPGEKVQLVELTEDERVKPEYLQGRLNA
jgi:hypothetical protein